MLSKIRIARHERGLWFRYGDFKGLLEPGAYWFPSRFLLPGRDRVHVFSTLRTKFEHPLLDVLLTDEQVRAAVTVIDLDERQRALVWKDGRLEAILGPGRHAFWNGPWSYDVEAFEADRVRFEHDQLDAVLQFAGASEWLKGFEVQESQEALLFRNGALVERLGPGRYVYWHKGAHVTWVPVDRREQIADVAGQEILTSDKVTLRINLVVTYRVVDPELSLTAVTDSAQAVYRDAQLALREAVSARTLDALLSDKESVGEEVREALALSAPGYGIEVRAAGLKDVILPGDMKTILNQVIEAEKQAQANLIRRREETAAARSQANTARLLAENPVLARIKELEQLQEILAGTRLNLVVGQGDLVTQLRALVVPED